MRHCWVTSVVNWVGGVTEGAGFILDDLARGLDAGKNYPHQMSVDALP